CRKHRAWLERKLYEPFGGRTVVITHFAPHPKSIAPAYTGHPANPGFVLDLSPLMGRAALWIHGHTHTAFDYEVKGTRVVCNPRGYPGEPTGFRADLTLDLCPGSRASRCRTCRGADRAARARRAGSTPGGSRRAPPPRALRDRAARCARR